MKLFCSNCRQRIYFTIFDYGIVPENADGSIHICSIPEGSEIPSPYPIVIGESSDLKP